MGYTLYPHTIDIFRHCLGGCMSPREKRGQGKRPEGRADGWEGGIYDTFLSETRAR